ncbi:cell division protein FtsL [Neisseriaceae bacterium PsAf]|nr:cell division protein FtsL [Neisseriaceae bacterium PsAf]MCV2503895.1 cell division protein FtsL [Neisseriaceae bacterium]
MTKVNVFLLVVAFISAMILISMRSQTKGYFDRAENERRLAHNLEEEYRIMQLERARLTNITRIKQKASEIGMILPNYDTKRVLKAGY